MSKDIKLPRIRTGQGPDKLDRAAFDARFARHFFDPAFDGKRADIAALADIAWDAYQQGRKAPRTRKAGERFADPDYELSIEWLGARAAIDAAQREYEDPLRARRVLLVIGSPRNDKTCPGENSKSHELAQLARETIDAAGCHCDVLDLSVLTSEYGREIHPCKACVSTAMPLCHWPCSCYPNHSLGQSQDWMNEIYPRWVAAHGIFIITPVHWLQVPSTLKLMIDRLVCADGGNPDPSTTHGKTVDEAKRLELLGWHYPRHLAGRLFGVLAHGDTEGAGAVRNALVDWLTAIGLQPAGTPAVLERYIGYYQPYATSHDALDAEPALQEEVRVAARSLIEALQMQQRGWRAPGEALPEVRPK